MYLSDGYINNRDCNVIKLNEKDLQRIKENIIIDDFIREMVLNIILKLRMNIEHLICKI